MALIPLELVTATLQGTRGEIRDGTILSSTCSGWRLFAVTPERYWVQVQTPAPLRRDTAYSLDLWLGKEIIHCPGMVWDGETFVGTRPTIWEETR